MSRLPFLTAIALIIFLANCHKDNSTKAGGLIVFPVSVGGVWTVDSVSTTDYVNDSIIGGPIIQIRTPHYFNFYSSNKVVYTEMSTTDSTTYNIIHNDTIIMDLNHNKSLDTASIIQVVPSHRIKITWDFSKLILSSKKYKSTARFFLSK
jgi:hypothetical protein